MHFSKNIYNVKLRQIDDADTNYIQELNTYGEIEFDTKRGKYYIISNDNGDMMGVIGYIKANEKNTGFLQILIDPSYRGRGLFKFAVDELLKQENLKRLYSTISIYNEPSINAHLKYGFKFLDDDTIEKLRQHYFLSDTKTRMVYEV